jgi:beta-glucosidase
MKTKNLLATICLPVALLLFGAAPVPVYLDASQPIEERVEDALARMTLEEKIAMIHAQSKFSSPGVPRLGIPEIWCTDGPHGIRAEVFWDEWNQAGWTNDSCTAFPALTALAASWNRELSHLYGRSVGEEARYRNKNILLAPGVNIYRSPLNGRNFEYMGEDPYLAARMVVPYIHGVQENGVAACVKHFALNNQETNRHTVDVEVSDRALYEIYLPAFKAAVQEGGTWSIMGAYNRYKGQQACHNEYLLNDILKKEWGFDGVVVSDWGGAHDTKESIRNGLDLEFGTWTDGLSFGASNAYDNYHLAAPYLQMIREGEVGTQELDDKVRRILRLIFRTTMDPARPYGSFASEEHSLAARRIAQEGIVLLQNENALLPLDPTRTGKVLVVGENAVKMMTIGGGSSSLKARYEISPLQGIREYLSEKGEGAEVVFARGYVGEVSSRQDGLTGQSLQDDRTADELLAEAVEAAKTADVVLFFGGLNKSKYQDCEGDDRRTMDLPYGQDRLIEALVGANPRTVVVMISGNAVAMPWVAKVPSIVQGWYCGSEAGHALASVLFGGVNPSGKLPFSFPVKLEDNAAHALGEFPGDSVCRYNEGVLVGYRWHDTRKIKPLFAFGHGLSYTTFRYGEASADRREMTASEQITFSVEVTNTGELAGAEIVQLYIHDKKASVMRPDKELKGFEKLFLQPGETRTVRFTVDRQALSWFDEAQHAWTAEPGMFEARIGSASDRILSTVTFELKSSTE